MCTFGSNVHTYTILMVSYLFPEISDHAKILQQQSRGMEGRTHQKLDPSTWNHPKNHDKLDYMVFFDKKVLKIVIFKAPLLKIWGSEVNFFYFLGMFLVRAQTW